MIELVAPSNPGRAGLPPAYPTPCGGEGGGRPSDWPERPSESGEGPP